MGTAPDAVTEGSAEASVVEALRTVIDPEVGINVVDLGLVYGVSVADGRVDVAMTMTTPACPLGPLIRSQARRAIEDATPEAEVDVHLVWDPPWSSERVSLLGRRQLGLID
jgi:metal-sulfur cluster biosynthetic enzyme